MKRAVILSIMLFLVGTTHSLAMGLSLESPAFSSNTFIPERYTCQGTDYSPPLVWHNPAPNTISYVLVVDDPDAPGGTWVHWVLFNIPARVNALPEGVLLDNVAVSGLNSWGQTGYRGPCPPSGVHRYFFKLYALDTQLALNSEATQDRVNNAMQGHVIASAELIGLYQKRTHQSI